MPALNSSLPKKYLPTPPSEIDSFLSSLQVKKIFLEGKLPSSDGKAVQEARSKLNLDERCPILPLFYRPLRAVDRSYDPYDKPSALLKVRILNTYGACIFLLPTLCAFHTFHFSPIFILCILPREIFFLSLNFQGRDGPALKDKLIELVHKKPRKTTETQDANSLSSSEQSFQPSTLLQETDSGQSNFQTSTDGESLLNGSEKRPNSEIIADIEGLKLDLLILQKQVQENTKLLSMENIQKQDGNALGVELLDYKKKCEKKCGRKMFVP